jgi:dienelactone hydrolase
MVLHMARAGMDLDAVVSFHGSLGTQTPAQTGQFTARLLVLNGAADPFVPPGQDMQQAGVDYQLVSCDGVKHSFTNTDADRYGKEFGMPLAYDAHADQDSWQRTQAFFTTVFTEK